MRTFTRLMSVVMITLLFTTTASADHLSAKYLFAARMNGGQEVPAVSTNALGLGFFYLNDTRDTLCFEMTATGLSGAISGIHIHDGAAGTNGPVLVDMTTYVTGNRIKGTLSGSALTTSLIQKMFASELYLNLHTAANMNGEIRGQILPEEDKGMSVMIDGSQEVPAVTTNATGLGFFMLQKHEGKLSFNIVADGLSGAITGAHLHKAVAGSNGGVVQDLSSFISGNRISGSVDPSMYLEALKGDSLYLNIHTAANPNGEIRGQLVLEHYLHFDAMLDEAQETTPVMGTNDGIGEATMKLNYTFDTLWYHAQMNDLSGAITGAHFHKGAAGTSGGVVVAIPSGNINGNVISGMITGTALADSFVEDLLSGAIYLNIHTTLNPNGEVRGQAYRTFREGYTYHLNGAQEVPEVSSNASGTGMVSIDRDQTSAHYMMVFDDLTGFSAAHFHNNVSGMNGPVMYNIGVNHSNGGIFGYWTEDDATTPFTTAMSNKFRKDSVYVNVHTTANADGEIRGDVKRTQCNAIPTDVVNINGVTVETQLYPNPTFDNATLEVSMSDRSKTTVAVYDMTGRKMWVAEQTFQVGMNKINIPTKNLPAGLYNIQIRTEQGQTSLKLTKQ